MDHYQPNCSELDHAEPNQGLDRQITICNIALLRCYTAESGNSAPTFQDKLSIPASRVKKSKRENRTWWKWTDNLIFRDFSL